MPSSFNLVANKTFCFWGLKRNNLWRSAALSKHNRLVCHYSSEDLTHIDQKGKAVMVDVAPKPIVERIAVATGKVKVSSLLFGKIESNDLKKGDVFSVARIAAMQACKKTSFIIPLCHQINLESIQIELNLNKIGSCVDIRCVCKCSHKTGVEMEALTGVSVAALTIYDMGKAIDPRIEITDIKLEAKQKLSN